jgi:small GTP-binding protein
MVGDQLIKVRMWDTAGAPRHAKFTEEYLPKSDGLIFVYDICSQQSFDRIGSWIELAKQTLPRFDTTAKILVGNKCDLESFRMISPQTGAALATSAGMPFIETSAATGHNFASIMSSLLTTGV